MKMKCREYGPSDHIYNTTFLQINNGPSKLVFHCIILERPARYKHQSFSGPFISLKENEVL